METASVPWVEKYRPATLGDLVANADMLKTLRKYVDSERIPHLLLYGPPGTGKTSTALAIARQLYGHNMNTMVLELNASDDRGIDVVRGDIVNFASVRAVARQGYKMIILDEADQMTKDAQNALRRTMEKYTSNVRFAILCNYQSHIIPALQSRCTRFRFAPLAPEIMIARLQQIAEKEHLKVDDGGLNAVARLAHGDMRRSLNLLQSVAASHDVINELNVYSCAGHPLPSDIDRVLHALLNERLTQAVQTIRDIQVAKGVALQDILLEIHPFVYRIDFPTSVQIVILERLAEIEFRLARGSSEKLQLSALVAAFQSARDLPTPVATAVDTAIK